MLQHSCLCWSWSVRLCCAHVRNCCPPTHLATSTSSLVVGTCWYTPCPPACLDFGVRRRRRQRRRRLPVHADATHVDLWTGLWIGAVTYPHQTREIFVTLYQIPNSWYYWRAEKWGFVAFSSTKITGQTTWSEQTSPRRRSDESNQSNNFFMAGFYGNLFMADWELNPNCTRPNPN